jgi:hypothetical protein
LTARVTVQVEEVESVRSERAVCIVRSLEGVTSKGTIFDFIENGDELSRVSIRVESLWKYGKELEIIDSVHTARLFLAGLGLENIKLSAILIGDASSPQEI